MGEEIETELLAMLLKGIFVKRNREGTKGRDHGAMEDSLCVCVNDGGFRATADGDDPGG